ncbi:hypothetical protein PO878_04100 [Iamia majanohamensis]|uniref:Uncharacterized protein n=1 Tax=Iamia majanohamensis TaxID=467976 RepID=A0AAE9Y725_9ACTN|nr:hypothetical protein [Iamia majanohamensis]WCO67905.1 hypothetical protein PO878_04100 [Iamia majanohamensis]
MQPDPTPALTDEMRAEGWDAYLGRDIPHDDTWEIVAGEAPMLVSMPLVAERVFIARRKPLTAEVPLDLLRRLTNFAARSSTVDPDNLTATVGAARALITQAEADR